MKRLRDFAIGTLAVNIVVIVLGALVRATGSGAGCGNSWPTCEGTFLPELEGATAIEFMHRASSGLALILVAVLVWQVFRHTSKGAPARIGAVVSGISIVIEALIGAAIVLAELVADNASVARAVSVPIHLVSTFILLGGLVLTVFWLSGGRRLVFEGNRELVQPLMLIAVGLLAVGATGGITALADTLFPKEAFELSGLFERNTSQNIITELRALHPAVALLVGLSAAAWAGFNAWSAPGRKGRAAKVIVCLVAVEIVLGISNVLLLTPVWLSLIHLAVADGIWIAWVWLGAEVLQERTFELSD